MNQDNPFIFLIDVLFDIYIAIMLLRFLLQYVGADFYNPISQFIVKATQKPVVLTRRLLPSFRGLDIATLALVLALIIFKLILLSALSGIQPSIASLIIKAVFDLSQLIVDIFIFAVFLQAILSWVNPDPHNPVSGLLRNLTTPILRPIKKIMPPMGGFDFSPIAALIGLMFIKRIIVYIFQML